MILKRPTHNGVCREDGRLWWTLRRYRAPATLIECCWTISAFFPHCCEDLLYYYSMCYCVYEYVFICFFLCILNRTSAKSEGFVAPLSWWTWDFSSLSITANWVSANAVTRTKIKLYLTSDFKSFVNRWRSDLIQETWASLIHETWASHHIWLKSFSLLYKSKQATTVFMRLLKTKKLPLNLMLPNIYNNILGQ